MSDRFEPRAGLPIVAAEPQGLTRVIAVRLLVDTGASHSVLRPALLTDLGYDLSAPPRRIRIASLHQTDSVPIVITESISALGQIRRRIPLPAHSVPTTAGIDGVLGLSFMRGRKLTIDFVSGIITLE